MNPILRIIDLLTYNTYTVDNAQPVADAITLLERLSVDEAGAFYFKEDLQ